MLGLNFTKSPIFTNNISHTALTFCGKKDIHSFFLELQNCARLKR